MRKVILTNADKDLINRGGPLNQCLNKLMHLINEE
jgi:hypothetical protein